MEPMYKQLCLKELQRNDRPVKAYFKSPYWDEKVWRPVIRGNQAILAYEIYSLPHNPDEYQTIRSLNALVNEGKAELLWRKGTPWYVIK